jgi:hypothetical protein
VIKVLTGRIGQEWSGAGHGDNIADVLAAGGGGALAQSIVGSRAMSRVIPAAATAHQKPHFAIEGRKS